MAEPEENKKSHHRRNTILATKIAWAGLVTLPTIGLWTYKYTDGFSQMPEKAVHTSYTPPLDSALRKKATYAIKEHMMEVILGYQHRNRNIQLSETELKYGQRFARDLYKDFEVLAESRTDHGFYALLLRDKKTDQTLLNIAGMDFTSKVKEVLHDIDDAVMLSSGGTISQTQDAIDFARKAEEISMKTTGKNIAFVTGHSLGAYLSSYLAGMDLCKDAKYFLFDGPGVTTTTVNKCAELSGLSREQVERNFHDNCYSFTFTHNLLNTMGQQPGIALTATNDHARLRFFPEEHVYEDQFLDKMEKRDKFIDRTNDENSAAPPKVIGALLLLGMLPFVPEIARRFKRKKSDLPAPDAGEGVPAPVIAHSR